MGSNTAMQAMLTCGWILAAMGCGQQHENENGETAGVGGSGGSGTADPASSAVAGSVGGSGGSEAIHGQGTGGTPASSAAGAAGAQMVDGGDGGSGTAGTGGTSGSVEPAECSEPRVIAFDTGTNRPLPLHYDSRGRIDGFYDDTYFAYDDEDRVVKAGYPFYDEGSDGYRTTPIEYWDYDRPENGAVCHKYTLLGDEDLDRCYRADGQVSFQNGDSGSEYQFGYDEHGLVETIQRDGEDWRQYQFDLEYDEFGNVARVVDLDNPIPGVVRAFDAPGHYLFSYLQDEVGNVQEVRFRLNATDEWLTVSVDQEVEASVGWTGDEVDPPCLLPDYVGCGTQDLAGFARGLSSVFTFFPFAFEPGNVSDFEYDWDGDEVPDIRANYDFDPAGRFVHFDLELLGTPRLSIDVEHAESMIVEHIRDSSEDSETVRTFYYGCGEFDIDDYL